MPFTSDKNFNVKTLIFAKATASRWGSAKAFPIHSYRQAHDENGTLLPLRVKPFTIKGT